MVFQTDYLSYDLQLIQSNLIGDIFDKAVDKIINTKSLDEGSLNAIVDEHDSAINLNSLQVMKCTVCDRLHVQTANGENLFDSYVKEGG